MERSISKHDEFILSCLSALRPMIRNLVFGSPMALEDAEQEAAIIIIQALPRMPMKVRNPVAWMNVIVRQEIIAHLSRLRRIALVSLDMPLGEGQTITLAEILPAPTPQRRTRKERTTRSKALRQLERCTTKQRAVLLAYYQVAWIDGNTRTVEGVRKQYQLTQKQFNRMRSRTVRRLAAGTQLFE